MASSSSEAGDASRLPKTESGRNRGEMSRKPDDKVVELDTLRTFTIPKMKKAKNELLQEVSEESVEFRREIIHAIEHSYKNRESANRLSFTNAYIVRNTAILNDNSYDQSTKSTVQRLTKFFNKLNITDPPFDEERQSTPEGDTDFVEKRKKMRQDHSEKELQDSYAFLYVKSETEMRKICAQGVCVGNSSLTCLGNPAMGVYLCKHADILQPKPFTNGQSGFIIIFKILKGKVKFMVENRTGEPLDPTPDFDSHASKSVNIDLATVSLQEAYESTQIYLYEYDDDFELLERPRQIHPCAVVAFRFTIGSKSASRQKVAPSLPSAGRQTSFPSKPPRPMVPPDLPSGYTISGGSGPPLLDWLPQPMPPPVRMDPRAALAQTVVIVWRGPLCFKSSTICDVELVSGVAPDYRLSQIGSALTLDNRVAHTLLYRRYMLDRLSALDRDGRQCLATGLTYSYCQLRPYGSDMRSFSQVAMGMAQWECGCVVELSHEAHLVILSDCNLTRRLGVANPAVWSASVLHCIFILTQPGFSHLSAASIEQTFLDKRTRVEEDAESLQYAFSSDSDEGSDNLPVTRGRHRRPSRSLSPGSSGSHPVDPANRPRSLLSLPLPSDSPEYDDYVSDNNSNNSSSRVSRRSRAGHVPRYVPTAIQTTSKYPSLEQRLDAMFSGGDSPVLGTMSPSSAPSSSIGGNEDELSEDELDIIRLRKNPVTLRHPSTETSRSRGGSSTREAAVPAGSADDLALSDALVDEIVRMKPLKALAARQSSTDLPAVSAADVAVRPQTKPTKVKGGKASGTVTAAAPPAVASSPGMPVAGRSPAVRTAKAPVTAKAPADTSRLLDPRREKKLPPAASQASPPVSRLPSAIGSLPPPASHQSPAVSQLPSVPAPTCHPPPAVPLSPSPSNQLADRLLSCAVSTAVPSAGQVMSASEAPLLQLHAIKSEIIYPHFTELETRSMMPASLSSSLPALTMPPAYVLSPSPQPVHSVPFPASILSPSPVSTVPSPMLVTPLSIMIQPIPDEACNDLQSQISQSHNIVTESTPQGEIEAVTHEYSLSSPSSAANRVSAPNPSLGDTVQEMSGEPTDEPMDEVTGGDWIPRSRDDGSEEFLADDGTGISCNTVPPSLEWKEDLVEESIGLILHSLNMNVLDRFGDVSNIVETVPEAELRCTWQIGIHYFLPFNKQYGIDEREVMSKATADARSLQLAAVPRRPHVIRPLVKAEKIAEQTKPKSKPCYRHHRPDDSAGCEPHATDNGSTWRRLTTADGRPLTSICNSCCSQHDAEKFFTAYYEHTDQVELMTCLSQHSFKSLVVKPVLERIATRSLARQLRQLTDVRHDQQMPDTVDHDSNDVADEFVFEVISGRRNRLRTWPKQLELVSIPAEPPEYRPNRHTVLLPLQSFEVVTSRDPRLLTSQPQTSIYCLLARAFTDCSPSEDWYERDLVSTLELIVEMNKWCVNIRVDPVLSRVAEKSAPSGSTETTGESVIDGTVDVTSSEACTSLVADIVLPAVSLQSSDVASGTEFAESAPAIPPVEPSALGFPSTEIPMQVTEQEPPSCVTVEVVTPAERPTVVESEIPTVVKQLSLVRVKVEPVDERQPTDVTASMPLTLPAQVATEAAMSPPVPAVSDTHVPSTKKRFAALTSAEELRRRLEKVEAKLNAIRNKTKIFDKKEPALVTTTTQGKSAPEPTADSSLPASRVPQPTLQVKSTEDRPGTSELDRILTATLAIPVSDIIASDDGAGDASRHIPSIEKAVTKDLAVSAAVPARKESGMESGASSSKDRPPVMPSKEKEKLEKDSEKPQRRSEKHSEEQSSSRTAPGSHGTSRSRVGETVRGSGSHSRASGSSRGDAETCKSGRGDAVISKSSGGDAVISKSSRGDVNTSRSSRGAVETARSSQGVTGTSRSGRGDVQSSSTEKISAAAQETEKVEKNIEVEWLKAAAALEGSVAQDAPASGTGTDLVSSSRRSSGREESQSGVASSRSQKSGSVEVEGSEIRVLAEKNKILERNERKRAEEARGKVRSVESVMQDCDSKSQPDTGKNRSRNERKLSDSGSRRGSTYDDRELESEPRSSLEMGQIHGREDTEVDFRSRRRSSLGDAEPGFDSASLERRGLSGKGDQEAFDSRSKKDSSVRNVDREFVSRGTLPRTSERSWDRREHGQNARDKTEAFNKMGSDFRFRRPPPMKPEPVYFATPQGQGRNRRPDDRNKLGKDILNRFALGYIGSLSMDTQWDSQFAESPSIKRIHVNTIRSWRLRNPLDLLISGRLKNIPPEWVPPRPNRKTERSVEGCWNELAWYVDRILDGSLMQENDFFGPAGNEMTDIMADFWEDPHGIQDEFMSASFSRELERKQLPFELNLPQFGRSRLPDEFSRPRIPMEFNRSGIPMKFGPSEIPDQFGQLGFPRHFGPPENLPVPPVSNFPSAAFGSIHNKDRDSFRLAPVEDQLSAEIPPGFPVHRQLNEETAASTVSPNVIEPSNDPVSEFLKAIRADAEQPSRQNTNNTTQEISEPKRKSRRHHRAEQSPIREKERLKRAVDNSETCQTKDKTETEPTISDPLDASRPDKVESRKRKISEKNDTDQKLAPISEPVQEPAQIESIGSKREKSENSNDENSRSAKHRKRSDRHHRSKERKRHRSKLDSVYEKSEEIIAGNSTVGEQPAVEVVMAVIEQSAAENVAGITKPSYKPVIVDAPLESTIEQRGVRLLDLLPGISGSADDARNFHSNLVTSGQSFKLALALALLDEDLSDKMTRSAKSRTGSLAAVLEYQNSDSEEERKMEEAIKCCEVADSEKTDRSTNLVFGFVSRFLDSCLSGTCTSFSPELVSQSENVIPISTPVVHLGTLVSSSAVEAAGYLYALENTVLPISESEKDANVVETVAVGTTNGSIGDNKPLETELEKPSNKRERIIKQESIALPKKILSSDFRDDDEEVILEMKSVRVISALGTEEDKRVIKDQRKASEKDDRNIAGKAGKSDLDLGSEAKKTGEKDEKKLSKKEDQSKLPSEKPERLSKDKHKSESRKYRDRKSSHSRDRKSEKSSRREERQERRKTDEHRSSRSRDSARVAKDDSKRCDQPKEIEKEKASDESSQRQMKSEKSEVSRSLERESKRGESDRTPMKPEKSESQRTSDRRSKRSDSEKSSSKVDLREVLRKRSKGDSGGGDKSESRKRGKERVQDNDATEEKRLRRDEDKPAKGRDMSFESFEAISDTELECCPSTKISDKKVKEDKHKVGREKVVSNSKSESSVLSPVALPAEKPSRSHSTTKSLEERAPRSSRSSEKRERQLAYDKLQPKAHDTGKTAHQSDRKHTGQNAGKTTDQKTTEHKVVQEPVAVAPAPAVEGSRNAMSIPLPAPPPPTPLPTPPLPTPPPSTAPLPAPTGIESIQQIINRTIGTVVKHSRPMILSPKNLLPKLLANRSEAAKAEAPKDDAVKTAIPDKSDPKPHPPVINLPETSDVSVAEMPGCITPPSSSEAHVSSVEEDSAESRAEPGESPTSGKSDRSPAVAKEPRFLQTFRRTQIAKRRSQREGQQTATGGKLLVPTKPTHTTVVGAKPPKLVLSATGLTSPGTKAEGLATHTSLVPQKADLSSPTIASATIVIPRPPEMVAEASEKVDMVVETEYKSGTEGVTDVQPMEMENKPSSFPPPVEITSLPPLPNDIPLELPPPPPPRDVEVSTAIVLLPTVGCSEAELSQTVLTSGPQMYSFPTDVPVTTEWSGIGLDCMSVADVPAAGGYNVPNYVYDQSSYQMYNYQAYCWQYGQYNQAWSQDAANAAPVLMTGEMTPGYPDAAYGYFPWQPMESSSSTEMPIVSPSIAPTPISFQPEDPMQFSSLPQHNAQVDDTELSGEMMDSLEDCDNGGSAMMPPWHRSRSPTPDATPSPNPNQIPSLLSLNPVIPPTFAPRAPVLTNRLRAPPKFTDRDMPVRPFARRPVGAFPRRPPMFLRTDGPSRPLLPTPVCLEGPRSRMPGADEHGGEMEQHPSQPIPRGFFVFCSCEEMHQSVQEFLVNGGMHLFDPHNVMLTLAMLPDMSCLVFIHATDVDQLHRIPNFLRLKRNLRILFVTFRNLDDVAGRTVRPVFPRAGLLVIHADVMLHCTPETFRLLCEFMMKQMQQASPWLLLLPSSITSQLETWSMSDDARLNGLSELIADYMSKGTIETLPCFDDLEPSHPRSLSDYHAHCLKLQETRFDQFRHFFFISDVPFRQPAVRAFIDCGIDVMNIPQFLRAFTGQTVLPDLPPGSSEELTNTYDDAASSTAAEPIIR